MISQADYKELLGQLHPAHLVAVSKLQEINKVETLYAYGQRVFGENRPQAMVERHELLPKDIQWHLIGQLQRNKVKHIAHFVEMIHSVDSWKLLQEIQKQAAKHERVIDFLFQIKIAQEESKSGYLMDELLADMKSYEFESLPNVRCRGLMGMASFSPDAELVRKEFATLRQSLIRLKEETHLGESPSCDQLSMGMSGDYGLAISEGSTMVRIGSGIFGSRSYG